jgi:hypothetical protein
MKPQAKNTDGEKLIQNGTRELRTCADAAADSARKEVIQNNADKSGRS